MADYIFTMIRASKFYGADRKVLDEITLAFLPGAKIGVLGRERRRQVDAAADHGGARGDVVRAAPSSRRARPSGCSSRSHSSIRRKDVRGNVEDGVRRLRDLLTRFEEISAAFAEPDADFDALIAEQAKVQEQIDRADAWSLDATIDRAMDALRLPDGDRDVTTLSGGERRRVALARLLLSTPDLLLLDEPTNHLDAESVAWLERFLADYAGTVVAVTHDRYFLDNVAGLDPRARPRQGHPVRGQLLGLAGAEAGAARRRGEAGVGAPARARARAGVGAGRAEGAPREVEGARRGVREAARRGEERQARPRRDPHPGGQRLGDLVVAADGLAKGFGDRLLFEDLSFSLPPGGIVGVVGPNGAGKTTLFRMIVGDEDAGRRRAARRRHRRDRLRRPGARRPDAGELGLEGDLGRTRHDRSSARAR